MSWKYTKKVWDDEEQEFEIQCYDDIDCEHCGVLEPYDLVFSDDCTTWCWDCMNANNGLPDEPLLTEVKEYSRKKKIEYFNKRIKQVEQEMRES